MVDAPDAPELDPTSSCTGGDRKTPGSGRSEARLDKSLKYRIYLSVNDLGMVILASIDRPVHGPPDRRDHLDSGKPGPGAGLPQAPGRGGPGGDGTRRTRTNRCGSVIILRVHKECPFEKTYGIMKACRQAEYEQFQWRANRGADGEGQITIAGAKSDAKPDVEFVARATSDDAGKLAQIKRSRGDEIAEEGLDLKADVDAFAKKLTELAAKNKGKRVALQLEVGDKLLQADVIRLIDAAVRAGFTDVWPVPIDKSKR